MPYEDSTLDKIHTALESISKHKAVRYCITSNIDSRNRGLSEDQFYACNLVDATNVTEADLELAKEGVFQYCKDNGGYAALPPFEEGAFVDRQERRYFHWKVLEVLEDGYRMVVEHYPLLVIDSDITGKHLGTDFTRVPRYCWYLSGRITVRVKSLTNEELQKLVSYHPDFNDLVLKHGGNDARVAKDIMQKYADHMISSGYNVGGVVEDYEYFYAQDLTKLRKKGKYEDEMGNLINATWVRDVIDSTMEHAVDRGLKSMLYVSCGPFVEMFTYLNYMLSNKTTPTSMHRTVSTMYATNSEIPDLRKERHFGKATIVSEKKPRAVNVQNIQRVYTTVAWQRRSHLRHYKSGKVVPIKSTTCTRHNKENTPAPQVVYKV